MKVTVLGDRFVVNAVLQAAFERVFAGSGDRSVAWEEVARRYFNENGPLVGTGCYKPPDGLGGDYKGATVGTSPAYSFGSAVCEVAVDLETGLGRMAQWMRGFLEGAPE
jgi:4-hydroxybenzoyl-CoA reductase subunit alpha